jgi:hypothetical protein
MRSTARCSPLRPEIEAVLMILPGVPCAMNCFAASCVPISTPLPLTSMIADQFSSVTSRKWSGLLKPALLNQMSSPPNDATAFWIAAAVCSRSVTFAWAKSALPPAAMMLFAACSAAAGSRSTMSTFAPSAANRWANASPIPLAAPVIPTVFPASLPAMVFLLVALFPLTVSSRWLMRSV